jgi:hypothetical protein
VHARHERVFSRGSLRFRLLGRTRAQAVTGDSEESRQKDAFCHGRVAAKRARSRARHNPSAAAKPRKARSENTKKANFR